MLDRTELELRLAAHVARSERANRTGWQRPRWTSRRQASQARRRGVPVLSALPLRSRLAG
jgi:hypothetical protein